MNNKIERIVIGNFPDAKKLEELKYQFSKGLDKINAKYETYFKKRPVDTNNPLSHPSDHEALAVQQQIDRDNKTISIITLNKELPIEIRDEVIELFTRIYPIQ